MVVAAEPQRERQTQKRLGEHVELIVDPPHFFFADVDRRVRSLAQEIEAAAQDRLVEAFGRVPARGLEQVAGDLFDHKLAIGQVAVERADHIVAIAEYIGDIIVKLMPGGLGIAHQVEPVASPALSIVRADEQPVDKPLVGVGGLIGHECGDLLGGGREAGQVIAQAADQGSLARFGRWRQTALLEGGQDESVDRIARPGRARFCVALASGIGTRRSG